MTTQEGFNYQTDLKRVSQYNEKNTGLFLDLKSNLRNALARYKKALLRLLDGVMKHPQSTGEGSTHER